MKIIVKEEGLKSIGSNLINNSEELNSEVKDKISFDEELTFPSDMLEKSDIIDIENARVVGDIFFDASNELTIRCNVSGKMILEDSISLDSVEYTFSIDIDGHTLTISLIAFCTSSLYPSLL